MSSARTRLTFFLLFVLVFGGLALWTIQLVGSRLQGAVATDGRFTFEGRAAIERTGERPRTLVWIMLDGLDSADIASLPGSVVGSGRTAQIECGSQSLNSATASLFTGLEPHEHGVTSLAHAGRARLAGEFLTVAERLGEEGFLTAASLALPQLEAELSGLGQGFDMVYGPTITRDAEAANARPSGRVLDEFEREWGEFLFGDEDLFIALHFADVRGAEIDEPERQASFTAELRSTLSQGDLHEDVRLAMNQLETDFGAGYQTLANYLLRRRSSPARAAFMEARHRSGVHMTGIAIRRVLSWLERADRAAQSRVLLVGVRGRDGSSEATAPFVPLTFTSGTWGRVSGVFAGSLTSVWPSPFGVAEPAEHRSEPKHDVWSLRNDTSVHVDMVATSRNVITRERLAPESDAVELSRDEGEALRLELRAEFDLESQLVVGSRPFEDLLVPLIASRLGEEWAGARGPIVDVTLDHHDHIFRVDTGTPGELVELVLAVVPPRGIDEELELEFVEGTGSEHFVGRPDHRIVEGTTPFAFRVRFDGSERPALAARVAGRKLRRSELRYRGRTWTRPGEWTLWVAPWLPEVGAALDAVSKGDDLEVEPGSGVLSISLRGFTSRPESSLGLLEQFRFVRRLGADE